MYPLECAVLHAEMVAELESEIEQLKSKNAILDKENEEYSGVCESLSVQSLLCVLYLWAVLCLVYFPQRRWLI